MKMLISLFITLLSRQIKGTVDMSEEAYHFIVDRLTIDECRKLVASLHFVTDELPSVLKIAEEKVPLNVSCYELLIFWNGGKEKWQGWGKSHEIVAKRLRQLGKDDLARCLSVMVFHNLAVDINKTIINYVYEDNKRDNVIPKHKLFNEKHLSACKCWEIYDTLLCVAIIIMSCVVLFSCCRIIYFACREMIFNKISHEDELQYLLRDRFASLELDS